MIQAIANVVLALVVVSITISVCIYILVVEVMLGFKKDTNKQAR